MTTKRVKKTKNRKTKRNANKKHVKKSKSRIRRLYWGGDDYGKFDMHALRMYNDFKKSFGTNGTAATKITDLINNTNNIKTRTPLEDSKKHKEINELLLTLNGLKTRLSKLDTRLEINGPNEPYREFDALYNAHLKYIPLDPPINAK
jgi:hypothetical protein